jgi:hypothetical protein
MQTNDQPKAVDVSFTGVVEPGNGARYEYLVWRTESQWYAAFPDYHACSKIGTGTHRVDYVQEKMRVSTPDAEVMTTIINECQRQVRDSQPRQGAPSIGDFLEQMRNG